MVSALAAVLLRHGREQLARAADLTFGELHALRDRHRASCHGVSPSSASAQAPCAGAAAPPRQLPSSDSSPAKKPLSHARCSFEERRDFRQDVELRALDRLLDGRAASAQSLGHGLQRADVVAAAEGQEGFVRHARVVR